MARMARVVAAGVPHHITQRGNNRQDIFLLDEDRRFYLDTLRERSQRHGLTLLGYCLMTNHVHLVAIPEAAQPAAKRPWPKPLPEQVRAIRAALADQPAPATPQQLARVFKRAPATRVEELLETLTALGQAYKTQDDRYTT